MAYHTITLSDNAELGLAAEVKRRNVDGQTGDALLTLEVEFLCGQYYATGVQAEAQAVTDAFLAAPPDAQATFRNQVVPIAVEVLGMEIPS